jgi:late competence protein required for DNA uptake (superfamily II DNA/RNA helicase)
MSHFFYYHHGKKMNSPKVFWVNPFKKKFGRTLKIEKLEVKAYKQALGLDTR